MITIRLFDGGTYDRRAENDAPGMDLVWWPEIDCEEEYQWMEEVTRHQINAGMQEAPDPVVCNPWPDPLPGCCYVDWTERYDTGSNGLAINLHHVDTVGEVADLVPAGEAVLDAANAEPETQRREARFTGALTWREVQARLATLDPPVAVLRQDTLNETDARVDLGPPLELKVTGMPGGAYRLEVPDNALFTPFDLRDLDRYVMTDAEGFPITDQARAADLHEGVDYELYLRPRRWRTTAFTIAHYLWITPFATVLNDEHFVRSSFNRPPVYPARHDILHTSLEFPMWGYYGDALSYDLGIEHQWQHCRSAQILAGEVLGQAFASISLAYVFLWAEPCELTISAYEPLGQEVVGVLVQVDRASGHRSVTWIWSKGSEADFLAEYPRQTLGEFWSYWNPAGIAI